MDGLLAWYAANKRDLPWRGERDPYRVLVSEAMLQQTRVTTIIPRYRRWLARFPTIDALASASEEDVMAEWAGLGYYRRAAALHAAAQVIVAEGWPRSLAGLRVLPGVGPYTAAALASICYDVPAAVVDGNVERVMARVFDIDQDVTKAAGRRAVQSAAHAVLDRDRPGDWNQAVMELGATVCIPNPRCEACPLDACASRTAGTVQERPVRPTRKAPVVEAVRVAAVFDGDRVLLVRRRAGLLAGTWSLPGGADDELEQVVMEQTGVQIHLGGSTHLRHVFSHRVWEMHVHAAAASSSAPVADGVRWQPLDRLHELGVNVAARRAIEAVQRM